ncbi:phosphoglycerate mutase [bacterium (Candidatus Howlettbacteria) CG_4_10_14_0_8_um_filter_40_9]|nr:MAG: phosphoglycerate mutase [bacterium (Candidatus Howlettbacteria) CG_4_10_14_0_8_um_filter_40_9]
MKKILFVILDGLGDRPIKELGDMTPLEAAETPNMDFLAKGGICGVQNMLPRGVYPTSEECHLALFGYDYIKDYPGRGVLEALGAGIKLGPDDLAFRVDIGTVDDNLILIDPHAGGVETVKELTDSLQNIEIEGVKCEIFPTLEHRAVLVFRDPDGRLSHDFNDHSTRVTDTDPHKAGPHAKNVKVLEPKELDDSKEADFTVKVLKEYQKQTAEILKNHDFNKERVANGKLPCNYILTRGVGKLRDTDSFEKKYGLKAAAVAGAPLYKGIAKYLGMDLHEDLTFTGTADTNLDGKVKKAIELLTTNDQRPTTNFVYLHIKATDSLAEDFGDYKGKRDFIEKIDKAFEPFLKMENVEIMITGDHTTSCELKDHTEDPVPFLIYNIDSIDSGQARMTGKFGESYCKEGGLGYINGIEFIKILLDSGQARMTKGEEDV